MTTESASERSEPPGDRRPPDTREIIQQQYALRSLRTARYGPADWAETGVEYLYDANTLLVRDEYLDACKAVLRELGIAPAADEDAPAWTEPVTAGVRLCHLDRGIRRLDALETLHAILGRSTNEELSVEGVEKLAPGAVSLNTFVTIAGDGGRCAPVEPRPMPVYATPVPGPSAEPRAGTGVRILVVDTGFDDTAASRSPWLTGVTGERDEGIDPVNGTIGRYAGHGTFIAGVLRSVAPGAEVHVLAPFTGVGEVTEASLVQALEACLAEQCPDIISLSAGTAAHDAQGPLALHVFGENLLARHKGVAVVAAAGNDNHRDLFYPAALPWAVSVGALGPNALGKASFSNFGGWVDVYAPGVDLVNAFPTGTYTYAEPDENGVIPPPAKFPGMARWSGTSFSTPIVAGLIAARMSETGQNARAAAAALLTEAQANAQYGLGAVLLPS